MAIKVGIYGYGNLGRGIENAIRQNPDMSLAAVFTRRDPSSLKLGSADVPVVSAAEVEQYKDKIDVMILCGGSATDLPVQTPALVAHFNVVDSFDTHARIPEHFAAVDAAAKAAGHAAMISVGWDPGMFSVNRLYAGAVLPEGTDYTYDEATGLFTTVPGVITVPAATYTQDPQTGVWTTVPGTATLTISGTV